MHFSHHPEIWSAFPELAAAALRCDGIRADAEVSAPVAAWHAQARERLATVATESELPQIQAWRRVFQRMGLKPTQYRCASESLLRRFKKEGALPPIHPLVDLCNAASMAHAIPVAAIDLDHVAGWLQVRRAAGTESYQAFGGEIEHPEPGEVTFVDAEGRAHARRWTHRQSGLSAVQPSTTRVLIVCEAVHADAAANVAQLARELAAALASGFGAEVRHGMLGPASPRFDG